MEASRSWLSWNWPAFLASLFWFAYRKMWLPLAVAIVLFLITNFFAGQSPANLAPAWLFLFVLAGLNGAIGNALYRRQIRNLVARTDALDQPAALAQLGAQGGISVPGLATMLGIFLLLFIAASIGQINQARMNAPPAVQPATPPQGDQSAAANSPAQAQQPVQTEQPAQPSAPTLDSTYLLGRWTSNGDNCSSSFNSDGTFTSANGGRGYWSLAGDRLALTGTSTLVLQVVPVDMNNMTLVQADGSLIRATRC